jgi:hypothetical protein
MAVMVNHLCVCLVVTWDCAGRPCARVFQKPSASLQEPSGAFRKNSPTAGLQDGFLDPAMEGLGLLWATASWVGSGSCSPLDAAFYLRQGRRSQVGREQATDNARPRAEDANTPTPLTKEEDEEMVGRRHLQGGREVYLMFTT